MEGREAAGGKAGPRGRTGSPCDRGARASRCGVRRPAGHGLGNFANDAAQAPPEGSGGTPKPARAPRALPDTRESLPAGFGCWGCERGKFHKINELWVYKQGGTKFFGKFVGSGLV
jgi:hypothetical protein